MRIITDKLAQAKDECPFSSWNKKRRDFDCVIKKRKHYADISCVDVRCRFVKVAEGPQLDDGAADERAADV